MIDNGFFSGVRVILDASCADMKVDTSRVRSIGRATRRHAIGHKQNFQYRLKPWKTVQRLPDGTLRMHPERFKELKKILEQQP